MSFILQNLYNNLDEPILVLNTSKNELYQNTAFENVFGKIEEKNWEQALKKLEYKFQSDICILKSEEINTYTPIFAGLNSKKNYCTFATFKKNKNESRNFIIKALLFKNFKVVYFYDITDTKKLEELQNENNLLKIQNQNFSSTNTKAQNQAVKMALLNRITTNIHKESDIKGLVLKALEELSAILGANKLYYGELNNKQYLIKYNFPKTKIANDSTLNIDKETLLELQTGKITTSFVFQNNIPTTKILMPILRQGNMVSIIEIYTNQKEINETEIELLTSISIQISNAILEVSLFEEIKDKNEKLENTLNELKETQLQLINSEKMASLGQLIASVAHEINTPLASISANNEIIKKISLDKKTIPQDMLSEINNIDKEAIKRITNIVQSLKRFVRLDERIVQEADVNSELDLTLTLLRHKTKNSIQIIKHYGELPLIKCYPNLLNQVFLNVLMNSIQAIEKKNAIDGKITITTKAIDNSVIIEIQDNGCGINKEEEKKIFQAGFTTKKVGEGTGLGLAICKKIVEEKHNGKISFTSDKSSTTFQISIPII